MTFRNRTSACLSAYVVAAILAESNVIFGQDKVDPLPAVYPDDFSYFAGKAFKVEMTADRTEVRVEEPLDLTIRITALGPWTHPPRAKGDKKINPFPADYLRDHAYVELKDEKEEKNAWIFTYRLKPKHKGATTIPGVQLRFHVPGTIDEFPFTVRTPEIVLKVLPRAKTETPDEVARAAVTPELYEIHTGPEVLARAGLERCSQPICLALLLLAPPLGCVAWYWIWRVRNPDAHQAARRRKSEAARAALTSLQNGATSPGGLAAVMAEYLRKRFDLSGAEPTPQEVGRVLFTCGVSRKLRDEVVSFLQSCDAGRFGAVALADAPRLSAEAATLINALEAEPCVQRAS
jgi:hypothetical protein